MKLIETKLSGAVILEPRVFGDSRGYFFESFNLDLFENLTGQRPVFVQDNQSYSSYGVLRGLHYQKGEYAQAKLVRVLKGTVIDVAVDIRKGSPTYGQHVAVELSEENKRQLFVPRGFAHGFVVLSETAEFFYKCDNFYAPGHEGGIIYNDPNLNIDWGVPADKLLVSDKDKKLPLLENATNDFTLTPQA
ncbi:dTDP-4-dehydrorhamnose 3,5-epimerase [Flammeovirgaceae bacterium SG7u.111]|nr:dTDP-4-dehydrorhamnose 3,5-epimerase [Flammeovirgaceae bacterium SG7u.132]WPO34037.1 dTDP-4-dehydrorhamnose 3,5-epimerase [Flammeovirgaceae bacterium SG7u.111]